MANNAFDDNRINGVDQRSYAERKAAEKLAKAKADARSKSFNAAKAKAGMKRVADNNYFAARVTGGITGPAGKFTNPLYK